MDKIGLDAAIYLRFIRLCRWLFTAVAFVTSAILIPINVTYNLAHVKAKDRDALSMLTIRNVSGNLLFAHVAVTYLITFLVIGFVYIHWREVVRLRRDWFRSPEYMQSFYARTLMVNNVPRKLQSDEGLRAIFESVHVPYPTTSVHIGRKVGRLPDLIEYHNDAVRELEAVLVKYLKGGKIGKKRPTITIGGFMGMGGEKKDAIDYYTCVFPPFLLLRTSGSRRPTLGTQPKAAARGTRGRGVPQPNRPPQARELRLRVHGRGAVRAHRREHAPPQEPQGRQGHARAEPQGHRTSPPPAVVPFHGVYTSMHADAERPVRRCGRTWGGARRRSAARRQSAGCG